jgi:hypothetical protein
MWQIPPKIVYNTAKRPITCLFVWIQVALEVLVAGPSSMMQPRRGFRRQWDTKIDWLNREHGP